jgi:hypothetical protein
MNYKSFTSRRAFGIELETSQTLSQSKIKKLITEKHHRPVTVKEFMHSKNNRNWHVKTDACCGGPGESYGLEVASYKGSGVEDMISIADTAQHLRDNGLKVNRNCGLHVHADVSDFTTQHVGFLLARWIAIEPWILNAVPIRRSFSVYCRGLRYVRPLKDKIYTANELWEHFKPDNPAYTNGLFGLELQMPQDYRRVALNLVNFNDEHLKARKKRCTVELRLPEGTLRRVDVKNWPRFFVNLVDAAFRDKKTVPLTAETLDEFFDACGVGHEGDFSILSPGLRETKLWLLHRLRKYHFKLDSKAIDDYIHRMTWPEKLAF